MTAQQAIEQIKVALDEGFDQIENGEIMESDLLESVNAIVDEYFS